MKICYCFEKLSLLLFPLLLLTSKVIKAETEAMPEHTALGIFVNSSYASTNLGLLYHLNNRIGLRIHGGFEYTSGYELDTAAITFLSIPDKYSIEGGIGIIYNALIRGKQSIGLYFVCLTQIYTLRLYTQNVFGARYAAKTIISSSLSTGIEPCYYFNKYIAIFSRLGIIGKYTPNKRYIDENDPRYNLENNVLPIREQKGTAQIHINTTGLNFGLRFYF